MNFSPPSLQTKLQAKLSDLAPHQAVVVALSGGLDSVVLLHALVELRAQSKINLQLRAFHINHHLQAQANIWQQFCADLCKQLSVDFSSTEVEISTQSGVENAAREARYRAFEKTLSAGEILLLAHHRDDQMETLLLRLMRGSGSRGLSGIPRSRQLGKGSLLRPLLEFDRQDLQRYAEDAQLKWMEDQSNQDEKYDRNYCRHRLLPLIESRWPGYRESWGKAALLAEESESLMQDLARLDLALAATDSISVVKIDKLLALSDARRRNLLRYWLATLDFAELGWNRLQQLSKELLQSGTNTRFIATDFQLRRYKNGLYVLQAGKAVVGDINKTSELSWNPVKVAALNLPNNGSLSCTQLSCIDDAVQGLALTSCTDLKIKYRQGGESCRLVGRPTKSLKKILQEVEMEPWWRTRLPLLYKDESLVCIPGIGVSEEYAAKTGEPGILLHWCRPDL